MPELLSVDDFFSFPDDHDALPEGWSVYWIGGEEFEAPNERAAFRVHQVMRFAGLI